MLYGSWTVQEPAQKVRVSRRPTMLKAAAGWLQQHEVWQALTPGRLGHTWGFLESPACAQYLEVGLVALVAHYHQQQQGRSAVLGGADVPADHQHMPGFQLKASKAPCFWEEMLEQLMSGFIIHFLLLPAAQSNQMMQTIRAIAGIECKAPAEEGEVEEASTPVAAAAAATSSSSSSNKEESDGGNSACGGTSSTSSSSVKCRAVVDGSGNGHLALSTPGRHVPSPF